MTLKNTQQNTKSSDLPICWLIIIGIIVAIGPLSIDMYLPALPSMADDFNTSITAISRSVPAYFVGLVIGQLFYGPLSDRIGRVWPMYLGMLFFVVASIICATTQSEWVLFFARVMQAMGACVTGVVTRAMIRDRLSPIASARAFSIVVLVMGVAPILAPSFGALMLKFSHWRSVFWFLAAFGAFCALLTKLFLKETLPKKARTKAPMMDAFKGYADLFKDGRFVLPAVAGGLLQGAFFIYLTIASELFIKGFGLSEGKFAIVFGANAFGFIALTQVNQLLTKKVHLVKLLRIGASMQCLFSFLLMLLGVGFGTGAPFVLVFLCIFCCIAFLGFTQPNATAIALAHQKHRAGLASAAQGALQFSVGIFGGFLLSLVDASAVTRLGVIMSILMAVGAFLVYKIDTTLDLSGNH